MKNIHVVQPMSLLVFAFVPVPRVIIGRYREVRDLQSEISKRKIKIGPVSERMIEEITVSSSLTQFEIFHATGDCLGFSGMFHLETLFETILNLGFERCPAEIGPVVRVSYRKPNHERLLLAMEPLSGESNYPRIFTLDRDLLLDSTRSDRTFFPHDDWLFCRRCG